MSMMKEHFTEVTNRIESNIEYALENVERCHMTQTFEVFKEVYNIFDYDVITGKFKRIDDTFNFIGLSDTTYSFSLYDGVNDFLVTVGSDRDIVYINVYCINATLELLIGYTIELEAYVWLHYYSIKED